MTNTTLLLSDEVRAVIDRRPHWMIRNGNGFVFLLLLSIVALTWFIRTPLVIHTWIQTRVWNGQFQGRMIISRRSAGEIQPGQHLMIQIQVSPATSIAMAAKVQSMSPVASTKDSIRVEIGLEGKPPVSAPAVVIVQNQRLLYRFLRPVL